VSVLLVVMHTSFYYFLLSLPHRRRQCIIIFIITRAAARVLEYSLLCTSGCVFPFLVAFFQLVDELLELMETWGFVISFATCQPGSRSEYIHVGRKLYATSSGGYHPFFVIGSLYLKYFRY